MKTTFALLAAASVAVAPAMAESKFAKFHRDVFNHVKAVRDALVPAPVIGFVEGFPPVAVPRAKILRLAQADVPPPPLPPPTSPIEEDVVAIADWANNFAAATAQRTLDGIFPRPAPRRPVIVGGEHDAKAAIALEEDLTVMMRILEKAADGREEEKARAMGIDVFSFARGPSAPRVFYIEGYGALFVLNVRHPLLAQPARDEQAATNQTTSSEWEKAREEIYGRRGRFDEHRARMAAEEFDPERVEALKQQIASDLANAVHIKGLKPEDCVTVVVLGGSAHGETVRREFRSGPRGGGFSAAGGGGGGRGEVRAVAGVSESVAGAPGQSTMTVRAKKSDIDALAKGKIEADDFRKKVSISIR